MRCVILALCRHTICCAALQISSWSLLEGSHPNAVAVSSAVYFWCDRCGWLVADLFAELELSNVKNRASFFMGLIRKRQTSGATNKDLTLPHFAPGSHTRAGIAGYEKRQKYKAGGRGGARGRVGRGSSRGGGGKGRGDRMKAGYRAGNRGRGRARGGTNHFGASKNPLFAQ